MKNFIFTIIVFLTAANNGICQSKYASKHIEQAVRKLNAESIDSLPVGTSTVKKNDRTITVRKSKDNVIEHIGIKLFPNRMREMNPSPVYDFVEYAYLSKLYSVTDDKLAFKDVVFENGNWSDLAFLTDSVECNVKNIDGKKYNVEWNIPEKGTVSIIFPIKYDLILSDSRRLIERKFIERACKFSPQYNADVVLADSSMLKKTKLAEIYECPGETYLDPVVNSSTYYIKQDSVFVPLSDKAYPELSIANAVLFSSNDILKDYDMTARFVCVENEVLEKSLSLRQLIDCAVADGCNTFVGISGIKDNIIKGTVFLYNRALGYDHIVSFTADISKIETHEMELKARVYLFSPTNNVKELFLDEKMKN